MYLFSINAMPYGQDSIRDFSLQFWDYKKKVFTKLQIRLSH